MGRNFDYPFAFDGRMARQQLARITMDASQLHNALRDDDALPGWVQLKISTAEDRLHMASDYMRYKIHPGLNAFDGTSIAPVTYPVATKEYAGPELTEEQKTFNLLAVIALGGAFITYVEVKDWLKKRKGKKA
jgi:hypothetical protein